MEPDYTLEELSLQEMTDLSAEMNGVLEKYNCEMAVRSNIEIMKRVPKTNDGTQTEETQQEATDIHQADSSPEA